MDEGEGSGLESAFRRTGLTERELWIRYLAIGGNADEISVSGQLHGLVELSRGEYNVLAHAVNEELYDLPEHLRGETVAYRELGLGLGARRRPE